MLRVIGEHWQLKILALLLAVGLWFFVASAERLEIALAVPIQYVGLGGPRAGEPDRGCGAAGLGIHRRPAHGRRHRRHPTGGSDAATGNRVEAVSRLFGTDGIRGVANEPPLTPDLAYRVGRELAATLAAEVGGGRVRLVIGRDTRRSGPLLEAAMVAGLLSAGADCYTVGVLPTPGIALLTRALDAQGGIVLSASRNPFGDNGSKLFSSEVTNFPDAWDLQ